MITELALFELSATDLAVTVTWPPVGTAVGAVYVVAMPLAVKYGLNDPQAIAGLQTQTTPACVLSFVTVAEAAVVPPGTTLEDSGAKTTEMDRDNVPGCVPGCEEPTPQPEMNRAKIKASTEKSNSPLFAALKFIGPPTPGRGHVS